VVTWKIAKVIRANSFLEKQWLSDDVITQYKIGKDICNFEELYIFRTKKQKQVLSRYRALKLKKLKK